ncbi:MAG: imidazole glycerol phosphate synthase subunit HisF [Candidatus Yanofskybacteria bacterium RIFCSPHIGHO2_02_FULL_38_22b]|uniref:imidazole glycerol-phosphate synthase n=1 Tax=Candidatus Yanofskybacteria bacterium RIFCSPHIGHO2_02_FULL_38_22b TaxID=1802673 RepID=A0A1F8F532_9BACT|nr:MAG: imidazole glycerol phosphate synthase subunit HisF [Candidatus Yanofskybacteria bacterium RIFCSPHIGHO2_01_FULL_39_44]OGN07768.1 MAG: imidazole glycerol phosphate synthase subunit HisF [Candidatus Yanofskybacteria bacterium RIFCSPHIGHO2_02_FULL_38_22b]OGN20650.1 MAG: imidazole glycerol phosphate synthase subunit HisF [Candidatus Yanofskybacteria bacterium RIFCSPLOWO2_01_FULL_39_28]
MLKTRVIPCMLYNGMHIVKTIKFGEMRTLGNPVQFAKVYDSRNVDELVFIDLAATEENRKSDLETVRKLMLECFMPVTIGGGIKNIQDITNLLKIGADKVCINTAAIENPGFITEAAKKFGSQCIVISIDAKKIGKDHYVFKNRGRTNIGKVALDWAKEIEQLGAGEIFLTSIDQDGTMGGYDLKLVKEVASAVKIPVIACGGAGKVQDIIDVVKIGKAHAASLASMFHYSGHTANSIKERMDKAGIAVRIL